MLSKSMHLALGLAQLVSAVDNRAAWITGPGESPLAVQAAPYPSPLPHEIVVRSGAVAINPVDWKVQYSGVFPVQYPHILGEDVAGEVVEVGSAVDAIAVGDRVIAYAQGLGTKDSRNGAFQLFVAVPAILTSKIPDSVPYTDGAVLPLGIATAAAGLFQDDYLRLPLPTHQSSKSAAATDKVVLVWGGSSSVGTSAIQLSVAAGVRVATTASQHNHGYVKDLGAEWAFDYRSDNVVDDIKTALEGLDFAGVYDAIGDQKTLDTAVAVVKALDQTGSAKVVTVNGGKNAVQDGVKILGFSASAIAKNEVGPAIFNDFLAPAIQSGQIKPRPEAWVIAEGLEGIQNGIDKSREGVSAQKVVVQVGTESDSVLHTELK